MRKRLMLGFVIAIIVAVGGFVAGRFFVIPQISPRPDDLGVTNGQLKPCPGDPNCVNSQAESGYAAMEPIPYSGDTAAAKSKMIQIIRSMERTEIITETTNYIHAEVTSQLWGFTDDVELYFDEDAQVIHFRSSARLGKSDMNVNRNRMKELRSQFESAS